LQHWEREHAVDTEPRIRMRLPLEVVRCLLGEVWSTVAMPWRKSAGWGSVRSLLRALFANVSPLQSIVFDEASFLDPERFTALASSLLQCAPVLLQHQPAAAEFIVPAVQWLTYASRALSGGAGLQRTVSTASHGHYKFLSGAMFEFLMLHDMVGNDADIRDILIRAVRVLLPPRLSAAVLQSLDRSTSLTKVPSKSTLHQWRMFFDLALMMSTRARFNKPDTYCYIMADSSPQFGRDWLLTEISLLSSSDAVGYSCLRHEAAACVLDYLEVLQMVDEPDVTDAERQTIDGLVQDLKGLHTQATMKANKMFTTCVLPPAGLVAGGQASFTSCTLSCTVASCRLALGNASAACASIELFRSPQTWELSSALRACQLERWRACFQSWPRTRIWRFQQMACLHSWVKRCRLRARRCKPSATSSMRIQIFQILQRRWGTKSSSLLSLGASRARR